MTVYPSILERSVPPSALSFFDHSQRSVCISDEAVYNDFIGTEVPHHGKQGAKTGLSGKQLPVQPFFTP